MSTKNSFEQQSDYYHVDSFAESFLNALATIGLVFGILIGLAAVVVGIYLWSTEWDELYGLISLGGLVFIFFTIFVWAKQKLIINVSRNLFNIKESLKALSGNETRNLIEIKEKVQKISEKVQE